MTSAPLKILVSVGELSGDEHAAAVIAALRKTGRRIEVRGMGGTNLRSRGVLTIVDSERSAGAMGFGAVVRSARKLYAAMQRMKRELVKWQPDLLLLVDYPDFNLRLAKFAKLHGVKVLYYIPPKLWAWREKRIEVMRKVIDCAAVIFPFEERFYRDRGFERVMFVGHPSVDQMPRKALDPIDRIEVILRMKLNPDRPIVGIFPGSRSFELERFLPPMIQGFLELKRRRPEVQGALVVASSLEDDQVQRFLPKDSGIALARGNVADLMRCFEGAVMKSGTSNLQAAICGLPFVMLYTVPPISAIIGHLFIKLREFSPVNVVRGKTVTELLQGEVNPAKIARELERVAFDAGAREKMRHDFQEVVTRLSSANSQIAGNTAAERVANLILQNCEK